jgi:PAS domain S-box-containing protein
MLLKKRGVMKQTFHYRRVLDSVPMGIFTVDTDWKITSFNRGAEKITGFTRKEALQCRCYEIFRTELCVNDCYLKTAMQTDKNTVELRNRILNKNNKEVPVSITAAVLRNKKGGIVGGVGSFLDDSLRVALEKRIEKSYTVEDIIGKDEKIDKLFDILSVVAESDASVLILGETGTGKDMFARATHNMSYRRHGPFVKVNCAALPDNLLESELFGYSQGAFTDAKKDKPGRFQLAQKGTIFLDEIGDLSLHLQAKLLQVLDEKEFYPLGARLPVSVDVRVVASTNRDLREMVQEGTFREDLYYRLRVIELEIPPLRERHADIPLLIDHFISELATRLGKNTPSVNTDTMELLLNYPYSGNVRELKNIIEHGVILCRSGEITVDNLPQCVLGQRKTTQPQIDRYRENLSLNPLVAKEREAIIEALGTNDWNVQKTANALGIDRTTLWRKMKKGGVSRKQKHRRAG